ncbi:MULTISPECIES: aspartate/glutamate racemase family protein [unclassified Streptosporangium]|uniref:aspartate/glutamate racemase family protein n=1 Tax=unclassified Streptosporangium TaxID=2632669 RepID=UPI002E29AA47|nr:MULTISPECIES: aspartate/glutamate racemase family protein [unclassified Streptosporangium]
MPRRRTAARLSLGHLGPHRVGPHGSAEPAFFACPDNTAHMALERPGPDLALPGLHIAEVVADQAARDGRTRVAVLGTGYTMNGPIYPRALAARGIAAEVPDLDDREVVNRIIFEELVNGS